VIVITDHEMGRMEVDGQTLRRGEVVKVANHLSGGGGSDVLIGEEVVESGSG